MLNEKLASLYEEMRPYARTADISMPMLMLSHLFIRYAMDNRLGLVLDRNFDLYLDMARDLENPYHLFTKEKLQTFLDAIDDSLEKTGYDRIGELPAWLSYMWDSGENARFREMLSARSFRQAYSDFIAEDFRDKSNMSSLLETLSHQARKDWRDEKSYTLGKMISQCMSLDDSSLVKTDMDNSRLLLAAIAIDSNARTITGNDDHATRILSPLSRRTGSIEPDEKCSLVITEEYPENLESSLEDTGNIAYLAPSSLLLSSSKENAEKREELISSHHIRAVIVLPSLTASETRNTTVMILTSGKNTEMLLADLNSKARDRDYFIDNQLTGRSLELLRGLMKDGSEVEGISRAVDYDEVEEKMILVPMNYLEGESYERKDTEELEKRIEKLYGKLAALMEL